VRVGLGARAGEVFVSLAEAGQAVLAVSRAVEARFRGWPSGPTQDEVKALEHEADRVISELLSMTNTMFVTPYDREDIVALAFAVDDVAVYVARSLASAAGDDVPPPHLPEGSQGVNPPDQA